MIDVARRIRPMALVGVVELGAVVSGLRARIVGANHAD